ncbi:MAG: lipopolysaccharide biosynthesis protein [Streptosporangiales bacterium]|nr:lipopolysaccharide biosynthesis protein [Streptosporangiales bacterium]
MSLLCLGGPRRSTRSQGGRIAGAGKELANRMESQPSGAIELTDYAVMLRRRWWVVVLATLAGGLLAAVAMVVLPKSYESSAWVQVSPVNSTSGEGGKDEVNLDTQAQLVKSATVGQAALDAMKSNEPYVDAIERVEVEVPPNSQVLTITYGDETPQLAQQGAHAFAQAYLDNRAAQARQKIRNEIQALQAELRERGKELDRWASRAGTATSGSTEKVLADTQLQVVKNDIAQINAKLSPLNTALTNITPGEIITDSTLPESASSPIPILWLGSGLMMGLLAGLMLAYVRDRSDKYLRSARDVERVADLPVLLSLRGSRNQGEIGLLPARSRAGQSFHELCHSITATLGHGSHVILVTGAAGGRGGNVVAANFAAGLARTESGVLLVCADLHSDTTSRLLDLQDGPGLSEVLLDRAELSRVEQRSPELASLRVIPPGMDGELASDFLQRDAMAQLIGRLRETARYVVIEAPSTSAGADAQAIADASDAALVVVELPRTHRDQVTEGVRQLDRMGTAVLGAVVLPYQGRSTPPRRPGPGPRAPRPRPVYPQQQDDYGPVQQPAPPQPRNDQTREFPQIRTDGVDRDLGEPVWPKRGATLSDESSDRPGR